MDKKISDSEIIQNVMNALGTNANALASDLDYSSHMTIYLIVKGQNSISKGLMDRIINRFPNVNYNYLCSGEGSVLLDQEATQNQMNLFNIPGRDSEVEVFFKKFIKSPDQLNRIEKKLDRVLDMLERKKDD